MFVLHFPTYSHLALSPSPPSPPSPYPQNFATLDQRHQDVSEHVRRLFDTVREQASGAQQQFGALNEQLLHQMDATRRLQDIITSLAQQQQPQQSPAAKRIADAAAAKEHGLGPGAGAGASADATDGSAVPAGMQQQFDALAQELEVCACVFLIFYYICSFPIPFKKETKGWQNQSL